MLHPRPHRHLTSGVIAAKCLSITDEEKKAVQTRTKIHKLPYLTLGKIFDLLITRKVLKVLEW